MAYDALGKTEENIKFLKEFVSENPYSDSAWFHLGISYVTLELHEKAIEAFDYALAINENSFMPHIAKANCYTTLENYPKAISTLNEALNFCKEKDLIFATIGANYYKMKNYEVAAIYFKKAAYLTPAYVEAWTQIALCYIEMNDFNSAIEYLNKGIVIKIYTYCRAILVRICIHSYLIFASQGLQFFAG